MRVLTIILLIANIFVDAQSLPLEVMQEKDVVKFDPEIFQILQKPSLADYERFALKNNPGIKAAYSHWQAAIEKVKVAKGLPYPRISFGYFLENIETAVGPQEYKIGINQMIPWFGKLKLKGDIQALRAESELQNLQSVINDLTYQLKEVYYDYYYLEHSISITKQNIELIENWEVVLQNKYKSAMAGYPDLIKTQIELIKLNDDLLTLHEKRQPILENFRSLLNVDTLYTIHIIDTLTYDSNKLSPMEVEKLILQYNPLLIQLELQEEMSDLSIRRAKLNYYPDLGIGIDYIVTGDKYMNSGVPVAESGKNPIVFMLSASIPLWWKKQGAEVKAAKYYKQSIEERLIEKENLFKLELKNILFEMDDARRKIDLYKERLIPKSVESLNVSERAYISGQSDFLDLIDAQRRNLQFQLNYEYSLVRYKKSYAKLEKLMGRKL